MKSMQAILDHGEIYATDARFLNDRDELVHAAQFADRLIRDQPQPPEVIEFVQRHVADWFSAFLSLKSPYRNYVSCFTSRRDDLSQWRAYSGGSTGASIALDLQNFDDLAPCVYRYEDKKRLLEDTFAETFTAGNMLFDKDPALLLMPATLDPQIEARSPWAAEIVKRAKYHLMAPILKILPLFKDPSFEAENEWRIVRLGSDITSEKDPIFYRPRMDSLVPTMTINIKGGDGRVPLAGLVVGPGSHPNASEAITRYLRSKEFAIEAEPSAVPYRSTTA
jgi:Protein of unknown function (DUF2971)